MIILLKIRLVRCLEYWTIQVVHTQLWGKYLFWGFKGDQSVYMSEIRGLYGMLMVVERIRVIWGI